jgi:AcrR family transcriptional regulator
MKFVGYSFILSHIMSTEKIHTWLKAGYDLLSTEGTEGIKIERLARILNLNKSGFYYYFGTMERFMKDLLHYHIAMAGHVAREIAGCEKIDPDLLRLIVHHKEFFLVESQLLVKSKPLHAEKDMDEAWQIVNPELIQLWRRVSGRTSDTDLTRAYLDIIRHFFYARIDPGNIHYDFLHTLAAETKEVLNRVIVDKQFSPRDEQHTPDT